MDCKEDLVGVFKCDNFSRRISATVHLYDKYKKAEEEGGRFRPDSMIYGKPEPYVSDLDIFDRYFGTIQLVYFFDKTIVNMLILKKPIWRFARHPHLSLSICLNTLKKYDMKYKQTIALDYYFAN